MLPFLLLRLCRRKDAPLLNTECPRGCGNEGWKGQRIHVNACVFVCVYLCGCYWVGCRWDLPLSVIEKCDLENVCPAEHESYLHGDGGKLRGDSPGPRQEEPVIGTMLTLRATLSPHHMQTNALFNSAVRSQTDETKKTTNCDPYSVQVHCESLTSKDTSRNFKHLRLEEHIYFYTKENKQKKVAPKHLLWIMWMTSHSQDGAVNERRRRSAFLNIWDL